jgi:ADP-ribose pyrophosphatase
VTPTIIPVATVHSRTHRHKGRVIDVGTEDVTLPSGVRTTLDVIRHPGASCVLPVVDDGRVVLIRQFRHCANGWLWEAPAGTLNPGETPEQCARREVTEESGLVAGRLEHVGFVFTAPGFTDEQIHLWLAHDCTPAPTHHDDDEVITEVRHFSAAEIDDLLRDGTLCDAKTMAVLLQWRVRQGR